MNIGIIEKNEDIAYHLKDIISEKCPHCQLKIWKNINDLKAEIREGIVYKILFVSVGENDAEVIEYMSRLQAIRNDLRLIYITDISPVVFEVFHSRPTYLLSKSLDDDHINNALTRALKELSISKEKNFTVINKQGIFTIPYTKIFYVESDKRKLNIYGSDGLIKSINLKISDFLHYEHGIYFLQCHKSYAVNLMHVSQLEKYEILLENGTKLPISQSRYMETRAGYLEYLENE